MLFFTAGLVIFEVPTGIIADTWGRRTSYLIGTLVLGISTLLYLMSWWAHAPFWVWAVSSILLGLGFTFFSGATEAWLVDALNFTGFKGNLESVFAKGQIASGAAMLSGTLAGGLIAQATNLGVPYIIRSAVLGITFIAAFILMKDLGFTPKPGTRLLLDMKKILTTSFKHGFGNPAFRWVMLAAPFSSGVGIYAFYAMQPHLLNLYGNEQAYGIVGLAAAIIAGAQIAGGFAVKYLKHIFRKRTSVLLFNVLVSTGLLSAIAFTANFWAAVIIFTLWGLIFTASWPVRQAYLNGLIPNKQRATVLSFDSLVGSSGGVFIQPALGRTADVWGYSLSYVFGAIMQIIALPFIMLARREKPKSDEIE